MKLLQDVSTRWNATLLMVDRFVVLEGFVRETIGLLDNSSPGLSSVNTGFLSYTGLENVGDEIS